MVKAYSLPEKYVNFIKDKAKELELTDSDTLRRIFDVYMELEHEKKLSKLEPKND